MDTPLPLPSVTNPTTVPASGAPIAVVDPEKTAPTVCRYCNGPVEVDITCLLIFKRGALVGLACQGCAAGKKIRR